MSADNKFLLTKVCPLFADTYMHLHVFEGSVTWVQWKMSSKGTAKVPPHPSPNPASNVRNLREAWRRPVRPCLSSQDLSSFLESLIRFTALYTTCHSQEVCEGMATPDLLTEPVLKPGHGQTTFHTVYLWRTKTVGDTTLRWTMLFVVILSVHRYILFLTRISISKVFYLQNYFFCSI